MEREERDSPRDVDSEFEIEDGPGVGKRRRIRVPISIEQSAVLSGFLTRVSLATKDEKAG